MFDGMDEIEGVDPYQIRDLRTGEGGGGDASGLGDWVPCDPSAKAACKPPGKWDEATCKCVGGGTPGWIGTVTGGLTAIGQAFQQQAKADVASQAQKLRQLAESGQISQQSFQQMQQLLMQRAQQLSQQPQTTFWGRYKAVIILGTLAAVGGVAYYFWRKGRK